MNLRLAMLWGGLFASIALRAEVHVFPERGWDGATVVRGTSSVGVKDADGFDLLTFDIAPEYLSHVKISVEPDGVVVDATAAKALAKGREVHIVAMGTRFEAPELQGEECRYRLALSSADNMAKVRAYIIGDRINEAGQSEWMAFGPYGGPFFTVVSKARREYDVPFDGTRMPERSKNYRWRFDFREADAPVKFYGARIAPYAEMKIPVPPMRPVKAELLFRATFDRGTAEADFAVGKKKPERAQGLRFVDGRRGGKAVSISSSDNSFLSYAGAGNMLPGRGSIVIWFKGRAGSADTGSRVPQNPFLFSSGGDFNQRYGKGFPYLWFWTGTLRFDYSPDGDGYQMCSLNVSDINWHCLVVAWNEYGATWFKDGHPAPACLADIQDALAFRGRVTYSLAVAPATFCLGSTTDGRGLFDCLVDDVRIYSDALSADQVRDLWLKDEGKEPPPPDYRSLVASSNRYEGDVAKFPGRIDPADLELVDERKLDNVPIREFEAVGKVRVRELRGVKYLEAENVQFCRFALGLHLTDAPLHYIEIDYPDDCERTMEFILQPAKDANGDYAMQVGVATGRDAAGVGYMPTGRILTHRAILWTRDRHVALVAMTRAKGARGVAVSAVRAFRIKSGRLPVADIKMPLRAPQRQFGIHFEDCPLGACFAVENEGRDPKSFVDGVERLAATMKFTGQNVLSFPGSWYRGMEDPALGERHPTHYMDGLMTVFDREGLGFMAAINTDVLPIDKGKVTPESLRDGSLMDSFLSAPDKGWPGAGKSRFNIAHPQTQRLLSEIVDRLLAEGAGHPSFRGITLHLNRQSVCWFGEPGCGFNDYAIKAFEKRWSMRIPVDCADSKRAEKYAAWLRTHAWDKWRQWKCETVGGFWIAQAKKMAAVRPDLRLWFNFNTCEEPVPEHYMKDDYPAQVQRDGGLDPEMIASACSNVVFSEGFCPADYRHGLCGEGLDATPEGRIRLFERYAKKEFYATLQNVSARMSHQHDRYWESNIGDPSVTGPGGAKPLTCKWMTEHNWRVSTINPSGRDVLRDFSLPLRFIDLMGMTKGGFLIGTYGAERYLAEFSAYFRALPAIPFETVSDWDGVVVRRLRLDGREFLYVVNGTDSLRTQRVPLSPGMRDVVTGEAFDGPADITLPRWQLRSFCAEKVQGNGQNQDKEIGRE